MGQTLTHGVYLPDEGERNCYNGLAANWQLLDGAVGTIAEHTSALSEKAPLVHTHTKSDITDFPVLANVATSGSYNDLSNIPASFTPASHTHGNITNDGKVGTTANKPLITGTGGAVQAGSFGNAANTFCEGNDSRLSDARTPVAHTHTKSDVTDLFNSANTWTNTNTFRQNITYERTNFFHQAVNPCYFLKDTELEKGSLASTAHAAYTGKWQDKNNENLGYMRFVEYDTGRQTAEIRVTNLIKNGALDPTGSEVNCTASLELQPSGEKSLIPEQNNDINLGTSTNKWKTLNGINPGALSLPGTGGYTDIKGDITNLSGGDNTFTAPYDGWVCVRSANATAIHIINTTWAVSQSATQSTAGTLCCLCPVMSGQSFKVIVSATSLEYAYIHPCKGNA